MLIIPYLTTIRRKLAFIGVVASILFIVLSLFIKQRHFGEFDFNTTVRIQDHVPKTYDAVLSMFSLVGSFEIISIFFLGVILLQRKLKYLLFFIPYGFAHIIELFGKAFLKHPGPPFLFFRYTLDFIFPSSYVQTGSSYPSGHSFRTVYVCMFILFFLWRTKKLPRNIKIILTLVATSLTFIMLLSRVSLGEHWTTDVVGGTLLGIAVSFLSLSFFL